MAYIIHLLGKKPCVPLLPPNLSLCDEPFKATTDKKSGLGRKIPEP